MLDGQQRLTSLYQALKGQAAVNTKDARGKSICRWYYIDMKLAVDSEAEREDALLSVPEDKQVKAFGGGNPRDVTTPEREYTASLFPTNQIFNSARWRRGYSEYWEKDSEKLDLFDEFEREVIERFEKYLVPVIEMKRETPKEAICLVFERVNTGGVPLTVFDLLTASFATDNFQLRNAWEECERKLKGRPVLRSLQSDDFLQTISLLATQKRRRAALANGTTGDKAPGISCKRKDILKLEVADWEIWSNR